MSTNDTPMIWEVTREFPQGHARPMTDAELAQHDKDQQEAAAWMARQQTAETNAATIRDELQAHIQDALDLAAALEGNTATPAQQRAGLALCLRGVARLAKVVYRQFDTAA